MPKLTISVQSTLTEHCAGNSFPLSTKSFLSVLHCGSSRKGDWVKSWNCTRKKKIIEIPSGDFRPSTESDSAIIPGPRWLKANRVIYLRDSIELCGKDSAIRAKKIITVNRSRKCPWSCDPVLKLCCRKVVFTWSLENSWNCSKSCSKHYLPPSHYLN